MISDKQLAANRLNAQKSTGPKSAEGKAVSSQNATRHGLLAKHVVIKDRGRDVSPPITMDIDINTAGNTNPVKLD